MNKRLRTLMVCGVGLLAAWVLYVGQWQVVRSAPETVSRAAAAGSAVPEAPPEIAVATSLPLVREQADVGDLLVTEPGGSPVAGALLFDGGERASARLVAAEALGTTGPAGIVKKPTGRHQLLVVAAGFLPKLVPSTAATAVLSRGRTVRGVVLDDRGALVAVPRVLMSRTAPTRGSALVDDPAFPGPAPEAVHRVEVRDGRFEVHGLADEPYHIRVPGAGMALRSVNGQSECVLDARAGECRLQMAVPVGINVVFPDDVVLSFAHEHAGGLARNGTANESVEWAIGGECLSSRAPGQSFRYLWIPDEHGLEIETFELLCCFRNAGPMRLDLRVESWPPGTTPREIKTECVPRQAGFVDIVVKDRRGAVVPTSALCRQVAGLQWHRATKKERRLLDPSRLAWQSLVGSGEPVEVPVGPITIELADPLLRPYASSHSVVIEPGRTTPVSVTLGTEIVRLVVRPEKLLKWSLTLVGNCTRGLEVSRRWMTDGPPLEIFVPTGKYVAHGSAASCLPLQRELLVSPTTPPEFVMGCFEHAR